MTRIFFRFSLLFAVLIFQTACNHLSKKQDIASLEVTTIHGTMTVTDPLIIELINSHPMQRLKQIRQYGIGDYVSPPAVPYSRYEHSLGVFMLLAQHNAPREEQVAGLLHDISHTVFSHATDPLFMGDFTKGAYQDTIHEQFLEKYGTGKILAKYGLTVQQVSPKNGDFPALEQEAPDLCADRLEYNLFAGHMDGFFSQADRKEIQSSLHFDGKKWYFDNAQIAKKFALVPLWETENRWGSPESILTGTWISEVLKRALEIGLVNMEEIHFTITDDQMWERLLESNDPLIQEKMQRTIHYKQYFSLNDSTYDTRLFSKFRGVDPLVQTSQGLKRLTEIDTEFSQKFNAVKQKMKQGWPVKWMKGSMQLAFVYQHSPFKQRI